MIILFITTYESRLLCSAVHLPWQASALRMALDSFHSSKSSEQPEVLGFPMSDSSNLGIFTEEISTTGVQSGAYWVSKS